MKILLLKEATQINRRLAGNLLPMPSTIPKLSGLDRKRRYNGMKNNNNNNKTSEKK